VTLFSTSSAARPALAPTDSAEHAAAERRLGRLATAAIIAALVIMVAAGLLRLGWMPPQLDMPASGPPWEINASISPKIISVTLWAAAVLAALGIGAALAAARRGKPLPIRTLLVAAAISVVALVVLPPVGSTDVLDYAIFGHIAAIGRSPYVMTPLQYQQLMHLHSGVPRDWNRDPSVYGPLATLEQLVAAKLSGSSLARTAFWLKLWNAIAFAGVAVAADRLFRDDRAARLRAHLLWTVNPLVIWSAIAAAHLDIVAAAIGLAGLLILDRRLIARPVPAALAAGICIGAAADIKAAFALYGLGVAWCLRGKRTELLAAAAGGLAVLVPSYAWAGLPAIKALGNRADTGLGDGFYGFIFPHLGISLGAVVPVAVCLLVPVAWLALRGLPAGLEDRPAIRAALALSLAWLLVWPHQFAWYSLMAICVLAFYRSSRLDWLALAWLSVMTIANIPGVGLGENSRLGPIITRIQSDNLNSIAPVVMLATLITMVVWCSTRRWNAAQDRAPVAASVPPAVPAVPQVLLTDTGSLRPTARS